MNEHRNRGSKPDRVVIVSGPSGAGKSTICRQAIEQLNNTCLSISVTTRPKSQDEVDGRDYRFISKEQFQERIDRGSLLEYAEVFGHLYGTPKETVDEALQAGKTIILEIDVQGARQTKRIYPDAVTIFILPPTRSKLAQRINGRGREDLKTAQERLNGADSEIAAARRYYQYMVVNDDLQQAVKQVVQIIQDSTGEKEQ